jgi:hypothetical protein
MCEQLIGSQSGEVETSGILRFVSVEIIHGLLSQFDEPQSQLQAAPVEG